MMENIERPMKAFAVTGTFHGSIIAARTEGQARRLFHAYYNGESIVVVKQRPLISLYT